MRLNVALDCQTLRNTILNQDGRDFRNEHITSAPLTDLVVAITIKTGRPVCFRYDYVVTEKSMSWFNKLSVAAAVIALSSSSATAENKPAAASADRVFELRQYTLHEGRRDTLISMFESNFIEPQNALGANIYGVFRDLDDPDRFVWIRGFSSMAARPKTLGDFYGGPVWQSLRNEANKTMVDSDNVLLLKPLTPNDGLVLHPPTDSKSDGVVSAMIYYVGDVDAEKFGVFYNSDILPKLKTLNAHVIAQFVSEESPNNFPKLPVREKDRVFIWLGQWKNVAELDTFLDRYKRLSGLRDSAPEALLPAFMRKPEILRLKPAQRSPLK